MNAMLTQAELAEKCGLSGEFISRLECGKQKCGVSSLRKLSRALDVPPDILRGSASKELAAHPHGPP